MISNHIPLILIISTASTLIPFVFGVAVISRLNKELRQVLILLALAAGIEVLSFSVANAGHENSWICYVWTFLEYSCWVIVLSQWIGSLNLRKLLLASILPFGIFWGAILLIGSAKSMTVVYSSSILSSIIIFGCSWITLYNAGLDTSVRLPQNYRFWISSALLLYFAGNIVISSTGVYSFIVEEYAKLIYAYNFHAVLNITHNILLAYALVSGSLQGIKHFKPDARRLSKNRLFFPNTFAEKLN